MNPDTNNQAPNEQTIQPENQELQQQQPLQQSPFQPPAQPDQPQPKSKKKLILVIIAVLLVLGGGGAAAWILTKENKVAEKPQVAKSVEKKQPTGVMIDGIVFANQASDTSPYTIYQQALSGSKKNEAYTFTDASNYPGRFVSYGQNVIFDGTDGIYLSKDGGKSFKNIYELDPKLVDKGQAITSLKFSLDGKQIVFALLSGYNAKNTVKAIDLNGKNSTDLTSFDKAGVFVLSYDKSTNTLLYQTGCYFCDGTPSVPHSLNLTTTKDAELVQADESKIPTNYTVSPDGKKLLYFTGVNDAQLQEQLGGVGWYGGPPYKVMEIELASNKTSELASIGSLHEKKADGTFKDYIMSVGYTNDDQQPYYSADNKVFIAGKSTPLYESDNPINRVAFASASQLITVSYVDKGDSATYPVSYYAVASKKSTILLPNLLTDIAVTSSLN